MKSGLEETIQSVAPLLVTETSRRVQAMDTPESLLSKQFDLDTLLSVAYARNPMIRSASEAWFAALNRYPQAAYLEGILQQYNAFTKQLNLMTGGMEPQKQMMQDAYPFPGITALRSDLAQAEIQIARQEFAITLRDTLAMVKQAYHEYLYINTAVGITEENQQILEQMLQVVTQKFEAGQTTYNDVLKARITLSQLTDKLVTLENKRGTAMVEINSLTNREPQSTVGKAVESSPTMPKKPLEEIYTIADQQRQELYKMELQIKSMDLMIAMAQEMNRPEPALGLSYFQNRSGLLGKTVTTMSSSEDMPLPMSNVRPWFGEREAYVAELFSRKRAMQEELVNEKNSVRFEVNSAYYALDAAYRECELYRTSLLPDAKQSLDVAQTDYAGARIDFAEYLDAQQTWLDFNLMYDNAMREFGVMQAELERTVGTAMEE